MNSVNLVRWRAHRPQHARHHEHTTAGTGFGYWLVACTTCDTPVRIAGGGGLKTDAPSVAHTFTR